MAKVEIEKKKRKEMNKERCIVYMLIKEYKSVRDQANSFQANSEYDPCFRKEAVSLLRSAQYQAWNSMEMARRILYGISL